MVGFEYNFSNFWCSQLASTHINDVTQKKNYI